MNDLLAFALKLPLALGVFLLIAYAGTVSKRIAGVLLTFPILNGIAVIASNDPVVVANAIYPLVIFNCVLFAAVISWPQSLPPVRAASRWTRLLVRVAVWSIAWLAGAFIITHFRDAIGGAGLLLIAATIFALAFMRVCWSDRPARFEASAGAAGPPAHHLPRFIAFWTHGPGPWRIVFFAITYGCLFWVARAALDQKWVGMASTLPLSGFFALATLMDTDEVRSARLTLLPMRDTVFLGPLLVIPFNWMFSHALLALPPDATALHYLLLFALWTLAALAVLLMVPRLAARLDRAPTLR